MPRTEQRSDVTGRRTSVEMYEVAIDREWN
jgi:hypothetical protein